jgi:hypothetical protein
MPHDLGSSDAAPPAATSAADRRTVRRVAAFSAAAVAATAMATAGVASSAGADPGDGSIVRPAPTPAASAAPAPSASAAPTATAPAAAPQLKIQIAYDRVGRDLTLTFSFAGFVVEPLSSDGARLTFPTPAKRDIGLGETLAWGDGTNSDVPVTGRRCPNGSEPRTVHEIADRYQVTKRYQAPGTYTVNYTYFACGLNGGKISGTLTVNIPK